MKTPLWLTVAGLVLLTSGAIFGGAVGWSLARQSGAGDRKHDLHTMTSGGVVILFRMDNRTGEVDACPIARDLPGTAWIRLGQEGRIPIEKVNWFK